MRQHASAISQRFVLFLALQLCLPVAISQNARPAFEVATVRQSPPDANSSTGFWSPPGRGRFFASHVTLALLLQLAYGLDAGQIANKPSWMDVNLYDVEAKPEEGITLSREELMPRLQDLLHERFHLASHTEMRPTRGYALIIAKGGPHLTPTKGDHFSGYRINVSSGQMRGANWTMPILAKYLSSPAGFPVVDQTGLTGSYDINFAYEPEQTASSTDSTLPPLNDALKQATGLLLKPQTVKVETLVIDSADKVPSAN